MVGRWKGPEKLVLVLDEFHWTAAASPELPSVLQTLWDGGWKRGGKVMLALCGSWFATGGVAWYLSLFDARASFRQNVERQLLDECAPLFREPEFLLREELRDVTPFHAVLMAIAGGAHAPRPPGQGAFW
ncbi:MAG: hypothetical protein AB1730_26375 [Myxococcota bacterium]